MLLIIVSLSSYRSTHDELHEEKQEYNVIKENCHNDMTKIGNITSLLLCNIRIMYVLVIMKYVVMKHVIMKLVIMKLVILKHVLIGTCLFH